MPHHLLGQIGDVSRYVFCPGSQARARRIADQFENVVTVSEERGIVVYSGTYKGVFMTSCGTGMGGPATAIAIEELGQLGADTLIRVGSCGVLQEWLGPGSIILASGTYRDTGTGRGYLPLAFPAVPTFECCTSCMNRPWPWMFSQRRCRHRVGRLLRHAWRSTD
ncbi:MAG: hypothetical protein IPK19_17420 [Chloroflexi bacterium]|nr:hypothetical protein [Chloroflexota bacterium]